MPANGSQSLGGTLLRSLASTAARWALSLLVPLIPPGAVLLARGTDFVRGSHAVAGWVILVVAALFGVLCLSVAYNVALLLQRRRGRRRTLSVVPKGAPYSLKWDLGGKQTAAGSVPVMMVWGDFQITNVTKEGAVAVPRTILVAWCRVWRIFPYRLRVVGFGVHEHLDAGSTLSDRLHWMIDPPIRAEGQTLRAKIGLIDHLGRANWTPWLRWPYM